MKRFLLFVNRRKERADEKAKAIREQLLRLGAQRVDIEDQSTRGITALDYDCVVTLGGDGTLIRPGAAFRSRASISGTWAISRWRVRMQKYRVFWIS